MAHGGGRQGCGIDRARQHGTGEGGKGSRAVVIVLRHRATRGGGGLLDLDPVYDLT